MLDVGVTEISYLAHDFVDRFKNEKRQWKPLAARSNPSLPTFCFWKK